MRIVADESIPMVEEFFGQHGRLELLPGRDIDINDLVYADALLVRSVTPCDRNLLAGTPVRFVGSATIGMDHMDTAWLAEQSIGYANAPGCNANAVAEYVLTALLDVLLRERRRLSDLSVGIIGYGNVGRAVAAKLRPLGWRIKACDPPLQDQGVPDLVTQQQALACDVVCLHTPLTDTGPYPTRGMIDEHALQALHPNAVLLNAGRGGVIVESALKAWLYEHPGAAAILDVWSGEPDIDRELAGMCHIATPHIAGYSHDGKLAGTRMIYQAFCDYFQLELKPPACREEACRALAWPGQQGFWRNLRELTQMACPVGRDHEQLMHQVRETARLGEAFDRLRKKYPVRREFNNYQVEGVGLSQPEIVALAEVGFSVLGTL